MPTILERYQKTFAKDGELAQAANQLFPDGVTHDSRYMLSFPIYITRVDARVAVKIIDMLSEGTVCAE